MYESHQDQDSVVFLDHLQISSFQILTFVNAKRKTAGGDSKEFALQASKFARAKVKHSRPLNCYELMFCSLSLSLPRHRSWFTPHPTPPPTPHPHPPPPSLSFMCFICPFNRLGVKTRFFRFQLMKILQSALSTPRSLFLLNITFSVISHLT